MKLLSMSTEGQNRAGILVEDEVIEVTGLCEILENKGEWIEADADQTTYHHIEGRFRDVVDLFNYGIGRLKSIISKIGTDGTLAVECREKGVLRPLSRVRLNTPVLRPGKVLAVGLNYAAHAAEQNIDTPPVPLIFSKCTTALTPPGSAVLLPKVSNQIDYEAELALVIGKTGKNIKAGEAYEHIAGYTVMNDVTARDLQKREKQWVRAKGLDSFAPCGPWIVTVDEIEDPHTLDIELRLNGEVRQRSNTSDLIFKIPELIEFISQDITLEAGDIITTGTPSGVGVYSTPPRFLRDKDEIEITISGIGTLKNYAWAGSGHAAAES